MSTSEVVADHIRRLIFDGRLKQDEHIRQQDLAIELGVSRTPVREAVIVLSREGWLVNEPHRGAFVRGLEASSVRDHYEVLGFVYGLTARHAAERCTDIGLLNLLSAHRQLQGAESASDMRRASDAYLAQLCTVAQAPALSALSGSLERNVVPGNFFEVVPGASRSHKRGTAAITKRIRAGQPNEAEQACRDLLRQHGDRVVLLLNDRRSAAAFVS
jgi:DNA-binding GntR family transcriptional regulator